MNKQRKVLITITYNEMGIIIDTKAEEVAQPNLQRTCNELATDCTSRQAVIDWLKNEWNGMVTSLFDGIKALPAAQPNIIRCGECRHLHDNDCPVVGWGRDDDDYCAWAERDNDG